MEIIKVRIRWNCLWSYSRISKVIHKFFYSNFQKGEETEQCMLDAKLTIYFHGEIVF